MSNATKSACCPAAAAIAAAAVASDAVASDAVASAAVASAAVSSFKGPCVGIPDPRKCGCGCCLREVKVLEDRAIEKDGDIAESRHAAALRSAAAAAVVDASTIQYANDLPKGEVLLNPYPSLQRMKVKTMGEVKQMVVREMARDRKMGNTLAWIRDPWGFYGSDNRGDTLRRVMRGRKAFKRATEEEIGRLLPVYCMWLKTNKQHANRWEGMNEFLDELEADDQK